MDGSLFWNLGSSVQPLPTDAEVTRLIFEGAEGARPPWGVADLSGHQLDVVDHGARQRLQHCAMIWRCVRDEQLFAHGTRRPTPLLAALRPLLARIILGCTQDGGPSGVALLGPEITAPHIPRTAAMAARMEAGWGARPIPAGAPAPGPAAPAPEAPGPAAAAATAQGALDGAASAPSPPRVGRRVAAGGDGSKRGRGRPPRGGR